MEYMIAHLETAFICSDCGVREVLQNYKLYIFISLQQMGTWTILFTGMSTNQICDLFRY